MTLLKTRNLDISVAQRKLIHQLELEIESGTSWALLGRNGTGKTSLLHTLAKLMPAAAGEIYLEGESLAKLEGKPLARRVCLLCPKQFLKLRCWAVIPTINHFGRMIRKICWLSKTPLVTSI